MKRLLIAGLCLMPMAAHAQEAGTDGGVAFAAAIAPEQAFEVCLKADAITAAQCAMQKCKDASGGTDECIITSACGRGWSGSMGVTTGEVHWTETVCGAPNEAAVLAALTAFCKGQAKYATECFLASVWDEKGKEKTIEKSLNPKKLK